MAHPLRRLLALLSLVLVSAGWLVYAQEPPPRADVITASIANERVTLPRPEGWVAESPPEGSLLLYKLAGDNSSHIELKYTPNVKPETRARFFDSFHMSLKKMGFTPCRWHELPPPVILDDAETRRVVKPPTCPPPSGVRISEDRTIEGFSEAEASLYEVSSRGDLYQMVVLQAYRKQGAWLIIGMFPREQREQYAPRLEEILAGATFN